MPKAKGTTAPSRIKGPAKDFFALFGPLKKGKFGRDANEATLQGITKKPLRSERFFF